MTKDKKTRKHTLTNIFLFIAFGIVGYFLGNWIIQSRPSFQATEAYSTLGIILLILGIFLSFHVVIFIHELGHIIGGLLAGDSFGFMIVGPLHVESYNGRLRTRLNRSLSLYGGLALTLPKATTNFKKRRLRMVAGGPFASLFAAIFFELMAFLGEIYLSSHPQSGLEVQLWIDLSYVTAVLSLLIFIATIIPIKTGGFMSDGMQLVHLYQNKPESKAYAAINQLFASSLLGTRPRNFNAEWLADLRSLPDDTTMGVAANLYFYYFHLDRGDPEVAGRFLRLVEKHLQVYPAAFRKEILAEIGIYAGTFEKNLDKAQHIWKKVQPELKRRKGATYYIYQAVLASLQKQTIPFRQALDKANEQLKVTKEKGVALMQRDLLRQLLVDMKVG
ncbi:MAG: M50 family metallopeptidase [Bacteroidota bacterium]